MTKTRRSFTPEERLSIIREAEREGFTETAVNTIYRLPYYLAGNRSISQREPKD